MKKNVANTRKKVSQVFNQAKTQAKESLKLFEMIEKETLAKAKNLVKIPNQAERRKLTNEKIVASLRKMGLATQTEVDELRARVEDLESRLGAPKAPSMIQAADGGSETFPKG